MKKIKAICLAASLMIPGLAQAEISDGLIKIGILTDMSGPYSQMGGPGSVVAAKMAVEDCLKHECAGLRIEVVSADHQNKTDVATAKAREWIDRDKVDVLADLTNSAVSIAIQKLVTEKGRVALHSGPAVARLTNEDCSPNGFHWMFDTYSAASGTAAALTQAGKKTWYFLTVDYAFGHSLEKEATEMINQYGGKVLGHVRHPLNSGDFSSYLLQAQTSGAQVIGLANGTQDTVSAIKAARDFGISQGGQQVAGMLMFITDINALGLEVAQGLLFSEGFYWDLDDRTRAFSDRFQKLHGGIKPTQVHAGVYSSLLHYLRSVAKAKSDNWQIATATMRELPIDDDIMRNAKIRPDGRVIHDMYLFQVKKPSESKGPWDYYNLVSTIPGDVAFRPLSKSVCPLVKKG